MVAKTFVNDVDALAARLGEYSRRIAALERAIGRGSNPAEVRWETAWGDIAVGSFIGANPNYHVGAGYMYTLSATLIAGRQYALTYQQRLYVGTVRHNIKSDGVFIVPPGQPSQFEYWVNSPGTSGTVYVGCYMQHRFNCGEQGFAAGTHTMSLWADASYSPSQTATTRSDNAGSFWRLSDLGPIRF